VSRAAATICGGLLLGLKRKTIVEFSFLLAVPTMLAAIVFDLLKSAGGFSPGQFGFLAVGFIVSFITAIAGIKFLINFIKRNNFISFGIYRIIVAMMFWFAGGAR
jgi:undecaprenyl-diphosphatase